MHIVDWQLACSQIAWDTYVTFQTSIDLSFVSLKNFRQSLSQLRYVQSGFLGALDATVILSPGTKLMLLLAGHSCSHSSS